MSKNKQNPPAPPTNDNIKIYFMGTGKSQTIGVISYAIQGKVQSGFISWKEEDCKKAYDIKGQRKIVSLLDGSDMEGPEAMSEMINEAKGFVFIYTTRDLDKSLNFIETKHQQLVEANHGNPIRCIVLANHSDENMQSNINAPGEDLANQWGGTYFPISIRTGKNIQESVTFIIEQIVTEEIKKREAEMPKEDSENDAAKGGCCIIQ
ncbi:small GTP-binding protein [Histomonas meleagridis]|uniref:small GTP-binding protein n=1 Tax=Histomonas meleagridis TaxID=135588 RepID=UPI00355A484D|nr:small GTP-binding protein [Histomonas meleagridis]KAH0805985.1 small GTP-binding protein [Histomonas meleagridis]